MRRAWIHGDLPRIKHCSEPDTKYMSDLKDFLVELGGPILLMMIGVIVPIGLIAMWADSSQCRSQWRASGFQTNWGPVQGCLISRDGVTWIPADNYREIK